ncbi:MAG: ComEA family DNA-binding protein, partial [Clostridiales bacterium]|nr:ComEA family DNA-binding protein [Clostridiales bacterium]
FIHWYTVRENTEITIEDNSPAETTVTEMAENGGLVNLNTADVDELDSLMYIGKEEAELIIAYREQNGDFQSVDDIKNVDGITLIMEKVIIDNCYV